MAPSNIEGRPDGSTAILYPTVGEVMRCNPGNFFAGQEGGEHILRCRVVDVKTTATTTVVVVDRCRVVTGQVAWNPPPPDDRGFLGGLNEITKDGLKKK